jgi:hypothetical protein
MCGLSSHVAVLFALQRSNEKLVDEVKESRGRSKLVVVDELGAWMKGAGRSKNDASAPSDTDLQLIMMYQQSRINNSTKTHGNSVLEAATYLLNMFSGTQPGVLASMVLNPGQITSGFVFRLDIVLFVGVVSRRECDAF